MGISRCISGCFCDSVQFSHSVMSGALWPLSAACQASLSFTISRGLLKLISIELVMPSNHLILCRPLLLLPSIFPSIRVFSNESALRPRWPKYWSFSFTISPSNEHPGLISFRMDRLDLLAVQGTLRNCQKLVNTWRNTADTILAKQISDFYVGNCTYIEMIRCIF